MSLDDVNLIGCDDRSSFDPLPLRSQIRCSQLARWPRRLARPPIRSRDQPERTPELNTDEAEQLILAATGRITLLDAYEWIAEGYGLPNHTDRHRLLRALAALAPKAQPGIRALQAVTREMTQSKLDSAAILFKPDAITPAKRFRASLELLARYSPNRSLGTVNSSAVIASQREDAFTIQTLCAVAGLSYGDLLERTSGLPSDPRGPWSPSLLRAAFQVLDDVVSGRVTSELPGTVPTRPLDLMASVVDPPASGGWQAVDIYFRNGVPYEVLLAQRAAGGTWLAHRNQSSGLLSHGIADELCAALEAKGLNYRRSTLVGGTTPPSEIQELARSDKQIGVVVLDAEGRAAYTVVMASARDSGTASKSAARLRAMKRDASVPTALILTGKGWSARNETADLAVAFGGRLFTEEGLAPLIDDVLIAARTAPASLGHDDSEERTR